MENPVVSTWSLRLPEDCSIIAIRRTHEFIQEAFRSGSALKIDCSEVGRADLTSIQLLLSTAKSARLQGRRLELSEFSQQLRTTLERAGVAEDAINGEPSAQKRRGL
ncbi:MAG TPA: STAS domain-containing protein [Xanthobacteraceae bacterium]|nr:STAS domain-containing protein [Xanthobacteraceae bacterium]